MHWYDIAVPGLGVSPVFMGGLRFPGWLAV